MREAFSVSSPRTTGLRALNYSPAVEAIRRKACGKNSRPLLTLLSSIGPAYGSVFTRIDCEPEHGVELLSQIDMFATEPSGRVIRRDSMPKPHDHCILAWQILIAGAGTLGENEIYGRSVIADKRLVNKYVGPHAMVLTFKEPGGVWNLFTYAFLNSATGVGIVRSTSYGTKVLGIRADILQEIPVPLTSNLIANRVASLVRHAARKREEHLDSLVAARAEIEQLDVMQTALKLCMKRRRHCLTWDGGLPTLSAWNWASTGGALPFLKRRWKGRLRDVAKPDGVFRGERCTRIPCKKPHGVDFLMQRDVFLVRPIPRRIVHPGLPDRLLFPSDQTLLVASRGTLGEGEIFGRVVYPSGNMFQTAITEDMLRLELLPEHAATAYAFLSTLVGLRLLRSTAVGTKVLDLRLDLLRDLPFPDVMEDSQNRIKGFIEQSLRARIEAEDAESEAVRVIDEEVLPQWLD